MIRVEYVSFDRDDEVVGVQPPLFFQLREFRDVQAAYERLEIIELDRSRFEGEPVVQRPDYGLDGFRVIQLVLGVTLLVLVERFRIANAGCRVPQMIREG